MKLNDTIRKAIALAAKDSGGKTALARKAGMNRQNIIRYIDGTVNAINDAHWEKLYPHISKHLPNIPLPNDWPSQLMKKINDIDQPYQDDEDDSEEARAHWDLIRGFCFEQLQEFTIGCAKKMSPWELHDLTMIIRKKWRTIYEETLFEQGIENKRGR